MEEEINKIMRRIPERGKVASGSMKKIYCMQKVKFPSSAK